MKANIMVLLFFVLAVNFSWCQEKDRDSIYPKYHQFIIEVNHVQTQKFADSVNRHDTLRHKSLISKMEMAGIKNTPPMPPKSAAFEGKTIIHFTANPDRYIEYRVDLAAPEDDLARNRAYYFLKIDRKTMKASTFHPRFFEFYDAPVGFEQNANMYEILTTDKEDTKEFCGYKCYKLVVVRKDNPYRILELYVTDAIHLDYNPALKDPYLLEQFYPLYVKSYVKGAPHDSYTEYIFHEK